MSCLLAVTIHLPSSLAIFILCKLCDLNLALVQLSLSLSRLWVVQVIPRYLLARFLPPSLRVPACLHLCVLLPPLFLQMKARVVFAGTLSWTNKIPQEGESTIAVSINNRTSITEGKCVRMSGSESLSHFYNNQVTYLSLAVSQSVCVFVCILMHLIARSISPIYINVYMYMFILCAMGNRAGSQERVKCFRSK